MKAAIITFVIALVVTCCVNGMHLPSYPFKAGVSGLAEPHLPSGMRRGDTIIPETQMIDGYRPIYMMTKVGDRDQDQQTEFPMQAVY